MKSSVLLLPFALCVSASAESLRIDYEAEVFTVTSTPFGMSAPRGTVVTGYFVYDTATPDSNVSSSFGEYEHVGTADFRAEWTAHTITGSQSHTVVINDTTFSDTFRIVDGERPVGPEGGVMRLDDVPDEAVEMEIAITNTDGTYFSDDSLPNPFPFVSTDPEYPWPHTFTLRDASGILSLQFTRVTVHRGYVPVEAITYSSAGSSVTLEWIPTANASYNVEFSTTLAEWVTIAAGISGGTYIDPLVTRFAPDLPPGAGFYRVYE